MGGCKCTYRNCTVKSDGQTHMFHYPVFDKLRCHKWLTNGQRLEFLDLKVSQLKNRVVCQHHFTPDSFMNYKMDKLKFDAVPCLNGPYCDASDEPEEESCPMKSFDLNTIIGPEDIDNDQLNYKEKEANLPVKYADFLTSSEVSPLTTTLLKPAALKFKENDESTFTVFQHSKTKSESKKSPPMLIVTPYSKKEKIPNLSWEIPAEQEAPKIEAGKATDDNNKRQEDTPKIKTKKRAIKIISEKKISTPLTLSGKLEPVSPSLVIRPRDKQIHNQPKSVPITNFENVEIIIHNAPDRQPNEQEVLDPLMIPSHEQVNQEALTFNIECQDHKANMGSTNQIIEDQGQYIHYNSQPVATTNLQLCEPSLQVQTINSSQLKSQSSPKVSVLKSMIPPERVAAIEEKRKFNKKLRDMIEFCLDDDREKNLKGDNNVESNFTIATREFKPGKTMQNIVANSSESKVPINRVKHRINESPKDRKKHCANTEVVDTQKVVSYLSKDPCLPSLPEYGMASIEARLERMEKTLLRKIEQNSSRIMDLKNTLGTSVGKKRSVVTQTQEDEESHKKHLYQQISQYLSPDVNSLIYEEMFLNKFTWKLPNTSSEDTKLPKRRKRR